MTTAHLKNLVLIVLMVGASLSARMAAADDPILLSDINKIEGIELNNQVVSFAPLNGAQSGTKFFFTKSTAAAGNELWVTDGTALGTHLVKDINPGTAGSNPSAFAPADVSLTDVVYFAAKTENEGVELWKSDGTEAGTEMVMDINPGAASSNPTEIRTVPNGSTAYFAASTANEGRELWGSDGTSGTTQLLVDANPGSASSNPSSILFNGSIVAWSADNGTNGVEPWLAAGGLGIAMLSDVNPGAESSNPRDFIVQPGADKLLFIAESVASGKEVWVTDFTGMTPTTSVLKEIGPGSVSSNPVALRALNGTAAVFFTTEEDISDDLTVDPVTLWTTDGSSAGTTIVKAFGDTIPISTSFVEFTSFFTPFGISVNPLAVSDGKIYFFSSETENGRTDFYSLFEAELWVSDGTDAGTKQVRDVFPGPGGSLSLDILPLNGSVIVPLSDGTHGRELWSSQGTSETTSLISDINPGIGGSIADTGAALSFGGLGQLVGGTTGALAQCVIGTQNKVVFTDGTTANTRVITDLGDPSRTQPSNAEFSVTLGQKALFAATDGVIGSELYVSDGTQAGTSLLKDLDPTGSSAPAQFQKFVDGSKAVFAASTPEVGTEPWITDGTSAGTALLRDIFPGSLGSLAVPIGAELNGKIFLSVLNGNSAPELWQTDGSSAGTTFLKNIQVNASSSFSKAATAGGKVFFQGFSAASGSELWVSDGTGAGTALVIDLVTGTASATPQRFTALGSEVIFTATTASGEEIWKSDGTAAGTSILKDINPGAGSSAPSNLFALNGLVYFSADDGLNGVEAWVTDGTTGGTKLLRDINPSGSSAPSNFKAVGNSVVFSAGDPTNGNEVWISSGTAESTVLLTDINPGSAGSNPDKFFSFPGTNLVFFAATNAANERGIWRTDGTADGTGLAAAIASATEFAAANGYLFFAADLGTTGQEPYSLRIDECPSDNEKLGPGTCGCGVPDDDSNGNLILDCAAAADLKAQANALKKAIGKFKPARNAKQLKKLKANKKVAAAALKALLAFAKANGSAIVLRGNVPLNKFTGKVKSDVSKALKLKGSLIADVKLAKTSLSALSKALT